MPDLTDAWVRPAVAWANAQPSWDAVVSSSGPYTAHLAALAVKRAGRTRLWVADFRDLWTANHVATGLFPFTLRERTLQQRCCAAADLLVTVSEGQATLLRDRAGRHVEIIYNGYSRRDLASLAPERALTSDRVHLVHTGTLYPRGQDPAPLLAALRRLRDERPALAARLRLVVAGPQTAVWREPARINAVSDLVEDRGLVARADALRLQRDADALLSFEWSPPRAGVLSGKLFEYLPWTAPILVLGGADDDPIASLVRRAGRGAALGRDPAVIAEMLARLAEDPAGQRRPGHPVIVDRLSREAQSRRLLGLIEDRVGAARSDCETVPREAGEGAPPSDR
jgi:glycosyltransferase involved in cell wall biosynthesis